MTQPADEATTFSLLKTFRPARLGVNYHRKPLVVLGVRCVSSLVAPHTYIRPNNFRQSVQSAYHSVGSV